MNRPTSTRHRARIAAISLSVALAASHALGADFWWRGDVSGTWFTPLTNTNFATDVTGLTDRFALPGALDTVFFATSNAANFNTTLGADFSIHRLSTVNLNPSVTDVTISGNNLEIRGGAIYVGKGTLTINSALSTASDILFIQTQGTNAHAVINSNIAGNFHLTLDGAGSGNGQFTLAGVNTYTEGTFISGYANVNITSPSALPVGRDVYLSESDLHLLASATIGNLQFNLPSNNGESSFITGTPGSTLTINGNISDGPEPGNGSGVVYVPISLPAGTHLIHDPDGGTSISLYSLVLAAPVSGAGGITKEGAGFNAVLNAPNTYAGPTVVNGGVLYLAATHALPTSTALTVNAGTLSLNPPFTATPVTAGNYNQTVSSLSGTGGTISLGSATLTVDQASDTTFAGSITGTGSLTKLGTGTLTLAGNTTFTGLTTISAGTLQIGDGGTTGSITGNVLNNAALVFNRAGTTQFVGNIAGSGSLTKTGAGTVTLTGTNTYASTTTIRGGSLSIFRTSSLPSGGDVHVVEGNLNLSASATVGSLTFGDGVLTGARSVTGSPGSTLTVNGNINFNGPGQPGLIQVPVSLPAGTHLIDNPNGQVGSSYDLVISSPISGAGGITKQGSGGFWVALTAQNTYTGPTIVNAGTLYLGTTNALPPAAALTVNAGTLRLNPTTTQHGVVAGNYNQTVGSLAGTGGSISLGSATLTVNQASSTTFAGSIFGTGGSLIKSGTGTLTLSGTNLHTGGTTITGGSLNITSATALPAGGDVTVAQGTFRLGASATVGDLTFGDGVLTGTRSVTGSP
jgi:fibronectin-binding autotransporter adhesin